MKRKIRVMAFGTFDHFHAGHETYLAEAHALGDELIVVVARDQTVRNIKGRAPDNSEKQRLEVIKKSGIATKVLLGELKNKYAVIKKYKPDIIALGYDQFPFTFRLNKFLIDSRMNTKVTRMKAYQPTVYKSSLIRATKHLNT